MCFKATCPNCQKTSWQGCGNHIPGVLDSIPTDQWCTCTPRVQKGDKEYPPKAGGGVAGAVGGLYNWITGKDGKEGKGEL